MVDLSALAVSAPLLVLCLIVALSGREHVTEAAVAVFAAFFAVLVGAIGGPAATDEIATITPTVVFLSVLLVLAHLADNEGVFTWAASLLAHRAGGPPTSLLRRVFVLAAVVTAVLSLDTTVVLLTPIIVGSLIRTKLSSRPYTYASVHLANSASLLMPVSNLTNLLAFAATGLSFLTFTAVMALPWLAAIAAEYVVLRRIFARDLANPDPGLEDREHPKMPVFAVVVVAATVLGFAVGSLLGIAPIWPAAAGALVLAARQLITRRASFLAIMESANIAFALFVLGLAVLVRGVQDSGLENLLGRLLPAGDQWWALLAVAGVAAILANVVNNLPATLALLPLAAALGTPTVLAVLIGVNVGSNLTYVGSLANLLWRRVLMPRGLAPSAREFTLVGLATVPLTLVVSTAALWVSIRIFL